MPARGVWSNTLTSRFFLRKTLSSNGWSYGLRFYISTQSQLMVATALAIAALVALAVLAFFAIRFLGDMLEKSARADSVLCCRHCKSKSIHLSYPSGLLDTAFSLFDCAPYRCEVCSYRFYVRRFTVSAGAAGR
jgi:hypothetical protein